jgi:S-formylglutathione hydrolase FrmB
MLHGLGGDQHMWESEGLFTTATNLIRSGAITPMIIVTPAGDDGYWMDHAANGPRYGSYISSDLVSMVDREYRTMPSAAYRAIGGMSMGGHGALQIALNNPDEFSIVGAHSVALRRKDEAFPFFGDLQYFQAHDPVSLVDKNPSVARKLSIWIDIGISDPWMGAASLFNQELTADHVQHVWMTSVGGHDGDYWQAHVADYLTFYGDAFAYHAASAAARY